MGEVGWTPSGEPTVCRRVGCRAPATDEVVQLCEVHGREHQALRAAVPPDPRRVLARRVNPHVVAQHGTPHMYRNRGCHCASCTNAQRLALREYRAR